MESPSYITQPPSLAKGGENQANRVGLRVTVDQDILQVKVEAMIHVSLLTHTILTSMNYTPKNHPPAALVTQNTV